VVQAVQSRCCRVAGAAEQVQRCRSGAEQVHIRCRVSAAEVQVQDKHRCSRVLQRSCRGAGAEVQRCCPRQSRDQRQREVQRFRQGADADMEVLICRVGAEIQQSCMCR
jgi:hypothetical protein